MTTIKEIFDKFNSRYRYSEKFEKTDIGDYTFDKAYMDNTRFLMEFTSKENPDVWLRINDDRGIIRLIKKTDNRTVNVTQWLRGEKTNKEFPLEKFKPIPENRRTPFPTEN